MPRTRKASVDTPAPDEAPPLVAASDPPSHAEWAALYEVAVRFRNLAPWDWLVDEQVFGVQNPETGAVGYCCVTGMLGQHFALVVYRGSAGLKALWDERAAVVPIEFRSPIAVLETQDCLMASFEDREMIEPQDRDVLRMLGLRFRGAGAWPLFRSYLPGTYPWFVDGAEARFLTIALEQAIEVTTRMREEPGLLPPPSPEGLYLVRVRKTTEEDGTPVWEDTLRHPDPLPAPEPIRIPAGDTAVLAALRELPRSTNGVLEMDLVRLPEPIQEAKGTRPVFPFVLLAAVALRQAPEPIIRTVSGRQQRARKGRQRAAASESGPIVGTEITLPAEAPAKFAAMLPQVIAQLEILPLAVVVRGPEAREYLAETAHALGIELRVEDELPSVDAALGSLFGFLDAGL